MQKYPFLPKTGITALYSFARVNLKILMAVLVVLFFVPPALKKIK